MNVTINGVEIILTSDQLKQIDEAVKKQNEPPKPTKEERFWNLISGLTLKIDFDKYPNIIFFFNGDVCWIEYELITGYLWLKYSAIWSVFEDQYHLDYNSIQSFIKSQVEQHFKMRGVTPTCLPGR